MPITLRTEIFPHQTFQEQITKFDINHLIDLEEKITALFISKMNVQEPDILPYKKQEAILVWFQIKNYILVDF